MNHIPAGAQTYSKGPRQFPANAPRYAVRGDGARVLCSDGRWYTDWTAALGPIVLGYRNSEVDRAVLRAMDDGPNFGLPTQIEGQVAERLCRIIPGAEAVRFGKNGSDATAAAVRASRAITGRQHIISLGYHGWSLEVGGGPNKTGVPPNVNAQIFDAWNIAYLDDFMPVAALIVEPDASSVMLDEMRGECDRRGIVLIFDEVLTGFRLNLGGAQAHYGVRADLVCLSKAMGNGYSVSAVLGPKKFMEPFAGGIGYSMTFAGETIGLAAAGATIDFMESHPVIDHLWKIGKQLQEGWNRIAKRLNLDIPCEGNPPRTVINWRGDMAAKTLVQQEMWRRGQMWTVGWTPSFSHGDADVDEALTAAEQSLSILAQHRDDPSVAVDGPIVGEVFRR